jgi:ketosteroid isomerase-like protein
MDMSVALMATSAWLIFAQVRGDARLVVGRMMPALESWRVAQEVMMLLQLAPLNLSQDQVEKLIALYRQESGSPGKTPATEQLNNLKQRLLRGEEVTPTEIRDVFTLMREVGRPERSGAPHALVDKILDVLEEWQMAVLTGGSWQFGARGARAKMGQEFAAEVLVAIANTPADQWSAVKASAVKRVVGAARATDREQLEQALGEFLERVRQMGADEVRRKVDEMVEEVEALATTSVPVMVLLRPLNMQEVRERVAQLFVNPVVPELLDEMAAARGWRHNQ